MTLRAYIEKNGLKQSEAATRLGISLALVNMMLAGSRKVSPGLAAKISIASEGQIAIEDLIYPGGLPEGAVLTSDKDTESA